ncbi:MAG: ATP-binding cassette domain-containing protein [Bacilli bacterium]
MIELKHLDKNFITSNPSQPVNYVLKDINLKINDNDFVTVIGTNGSGKSTLLNTIAGSLAPTNGDVLFDGLEVTNLKEYQRAKWIGRVFQDPNVGTIGEISIIENMALAMQRGEKRGLKWALNTSLLKECRERLAALNLGLEKRMNDKMSSLSGGQRQSITLLMATMTKPKLLLLDEHTAALDPKTSKNILALTQNLIEEKKLTAMMITHNMRDAINYGNRLIMISEGRIIADIGQDEKKNLKIEDLYARFDEAEKRN